MVNLYKAEDRMSNCVSSKSRVDDQVSVAVLHQRFLGQDQETGPHGLGGGDDGLGGGATVFRCEEGSSLFFGLSCHFHC